MDRPPFLDRSHPENWKALNGLARKVSQATEAAGLDRELIELMNIRISQLNGCSYCLDMHTRLALEAGATIQRIAQLPAWEESTLFDDVDCAVLAIADASTLLPGVEERSAYLAIARHTLGDETFAAVEWAAVTMNAFNRISILSAHPVRARTP